MQVLAVAQAQDLIEGAHIDGIDAVYGFSIPAEKTSNTDETIVLLRDANTNPDIWGSNDFVGLRREISVQIFYKDQLTTDPEEIETKLYKLFVHHDWEIGENRGHQLDPDTNQLYTTFYVYNTELIK